MPDLDDLDTFVTVADTGGVSPAARRLGLPKSVVSRRLSRLEHELGVQLLTRTTRGATLTEAGATFREHAARVGVEMQAACDSIAPEGEVRGVLRVSAPISFGATHIAPVLAELARRHPGLQVHASYSDRFVDLVAEGFDASIRLGMLPDSNLLARRIRSFRGSVVASAAYVATHGVPRTPDEVPSHPALMQGTESWRFVHDGGVRTVQPQGRFKADNGQALVSAVLAGLGIAALPDFLIEEHLASGALVSMLAEYPMPEAGLYVVRPPGGSPPRKLRALTEIMVEKFGTSTSGALD